MDDREPYEGEEEERPKLRFVDKRRTVVGDEAPAGAPADAAAGAPAPEGGPVSDPVAEPATHGEASPEPEDTASGPGAAPAPEAWTPEREEEARRLAAEIAGTPSIDWVINVAVTLANVAGAKISSGDVADARLAIDTLNAIIEGVGGRLQDAEQPLRQTLADLKLAFAQRSSIP